MNTQLNTMGPEWFEWIKHNIQRGCTHESIIDTLQKTWSRVESLNAFNDVLNSLSKVDFKRPLIDTATNFVQLPDCRPQILFTLSNPYIVLIDNVLSISECDAIVLLAKQKGLNGSTVVDYDSGASVVHDARTSSGTSFERSENQFITALETRLSTLSNWPLEKAEPIQVLQYRDGQQYKPHHDYFDVTKPGSASHLIRGGQRVGTFVVYLTDVEQGGSTIFPNLGVEVRPRKGAAVFFSDVDEQGKPNPETLHGGAPVITGTKIVATYWQRERQFV
ncbi:2OG-Fe(II) oxygenase [Candidatus Methylobacter oryzae]|uniref:Fe2OG dioxygenase domain-containing protein n=1 Tax=Candidatus Methylobacter oryzae TaxID=2497749 RepID=A0ABY3CGD8_9GAMM|nr:2OG-Fe(II) oxygenase [Candidatus Methylobacter oryzae]TRW98993.1 hypothetical protein EKO24_006855 [Candidatus Methylobacter oryzae]